MNVVAPAATAADSAGADGLLAFGHSFRRL